MLDRASIDSGKVGTVEFKWHTLTKIECRLMTLSLLATGLMSVFVRQFDAASVEITASRLQFVFTNGTLSDLVIHLVRRSSLLG